METVASGDEIVVVVGEVIDVGLGRDVTRQNPAAAAAAKTTAPAAYLRKLRLSAGRDASSTVSAEMRPGNHAIFSGCAPESLLRCYVLEIVKAMSGA